MSVVRVRCPLGGYAPCVDDLCHGSDTTICGLQRGYDFCEHDQDPDSCDECNDDMFDMGSDFDEAGAYVGN